jgi:2-oxoisovalerate dehydrogenase E2 component (dihydrolipoyl transacylase)
MADHLITMPDVGEGVAEAELVEWHVKPGDVVQEDTVLAAVMTDKATVEIPSPVSGTVRWLGGAVGDTIAVRAPLVRIETDGGTETGRDRLEQPASPTRMTEDTTSHERLLVARPAERDYSPESRPTLASHPPADGDARPLAAPAVRQRALNAGIDLRQIRGTGPAGRITHDDIDAVLTGIATPEDAQTARKTGTETIRLAGLRKRIAERMTLSAMRIPHITYVEEVDVSDLEDLRETMNRGRRPEQPKLTVLPFLMKAIVRAVAEQPSVNATFDDEAGLITRHAAVHIGVATQTPSGLTVPVVRHAEARSLWDCAGEVARLAEAARTGTAQRDELTGSTITLTSLGALGGIVTTPIINHPEVAIVGVNKIVVRPVWDGAQFVPRKMMNLSCSFDHRIIDGWDAATFVQRIKALIETPALMFIEG